MKNIIKCQADKWRDGYDVFRLHAEVAQSYRDLYDEARALGLIITSAGSLRRPESGANSKGRASASLHYLGRAFDLHTRSGMFDVASDPYLVEPRGDGSRRWDLYSPHPSSDVIRIAAAEWMGDEYICKNVYVNAYNVTELFARFGWEGIGYRSTFKSDGHYGSAEWWHFQNTEGLIPGVTRFGDELEKIYSFTRLRGTPAWANKNKVWDGVRFK